MIKVKIFYLKTNSSEENTNYVNNWIENANIKEIIHFSTEITKSSSYQVITIAYKENEKTEEEKFSEECSNWIKNITISNPFE